MRLDVDVPTIAEIDEIVKNYSSVGPAFAQGLEQGWYFVTSIMHLHRDLQLQFENLVLQSGPTPEALAASQITARAITLIRGIASLDRANEHSLAFASMRIAEENASNLFYILYGGPAHEGRTPSELAQQFLDYRNIEHARAIRKARDEYVARFKLGWIPPRTWNGPRTLRGFESHCDEVFAKEQVALNKHPGMTKRSWSNTNKEDRTKKVLEHLPDFASDPARKLWEGLAAVTGLHNMLLHSSPFLFQNDIEQLGAGHFMNIEEAKSESENQSFAAAQFAQLCWFALGDILGELPGVQTKSTQLQAEEWQKLAKKHEVRAIWQIDSNGKVI